MPHQIKKRLSFLIRRRTLLKGMGILGVGAMFFSLGRLPYGAEVINRIRARFMKPAAMPPDHERRVVTLPSEGPSIPLETALNSRCTSDYNERPEYFHWGIFDKTKKMSAGQVRKIRDLVKIPRFTDWRLDLCLDGNMLTCICDNRASGIEREWLMVESGMQQQAVGLICAALGVGMVFRNLGKDGTALSEADYGTVKLKIDAMKPTYGGAFWTTLPPAGRQPWVKGLFPDPDRQGNLPLLEMLGRVERVSDSPAKVTERSLGQLLWAAKGRTPHLYKSRAWGMTIPTWAGESVTELYVIENGILSRYVNWEKNRPTHSLAVVGEIDGSLYRSLGQGRPSGNTLVVLGKKEPFGRALWEVGYQLFNILLQASALDVGYEATLLDEAEKGGFRHMGINGPVAAIALNM